MKNLITLVLFWAVSQFSLALGVSHYVISPDYRKCVFPNCGGWWIQSVNQFSSEVPSLTLEPSLGKAIYVAKLDYQALGLTDKDIFLFEQQIVEGRALVAGVLAPYPSHDWPGFKQLSLSGTWVAANGQAPYGVFVQVKSTGTVCITTPCPYFEAQILNSFYRLDVHDLKLEKAMLTDDQEARAWKAMANEGVIMTGAGYQYQGQQGTGVGIAATQLYFSFPK